MNKKSKIAVLGASGLVGSAIVRKLLEKGYQNIIGTYHSHPHSHPHTHFHPHHIDLTNQAQTEAFFEQLKPEYVFLAAAKVGGILANDTYKAEFIYDNMAIALNVINSAYKYGVRKLLNLGSSCIYPKFAPQPMKEEYLLTGALEPTNEPYAIAKIAAIKLCRYYNDQYGTNFLSVMPTNLYGPNDNFNLETSHVLPALIRKFHLAKLLENGDFEAIKKDFKKYPIGFGLDNKLDLSDTAAILKVLKQIGISSSPSPSHSHSPSLSLSHTHSPIALTLWGTGEVYREFLYIEDMADACVFLMENVESEDMGKLNGDYFLNIGMGEDIKLIELACLIKEIVDYKGEIKHDLSKPDGTPRKLLDVSKIHELGWSPKISLEEGIRRTYEWYLKG